MSKLLKKRILTAVIIFLSVLVIGTSGYMIIEKYSFLDAVYMTVITMSTVGFEETHPLDNGGRIFTIFLILGNVLFLGYSITLVTNFFQETDLISYYRNKKMTQKIENLRDHVIVCGYGRTGRESCALLRRNQIPYVVVERDEGCLNELKNTEGQLYVGQDATTNEALIAAGIKHCRALITTLPGDSDNVFVTLTATELNPGLRIVSRATNANSIPKLRKAGASNVIMPYKIGGAHMASLVINPDIKEFIDLIAGYGEFHPHIEETDLSSYSPGFAGKTIGDIDLHGKTGLNIIGMKQGNKYIINPDDSQVYAAGDKMLLLGSPQQFEKLRRNLLEG